MSTVQRTTTVVSASGEVTTSTSSGKMPEGSWVSSVTFFLNGNKVVLPSSKIHPRMMLSEYLREHTRLTGTKLSCSQGGCGACNVMLTSFKDGKPTYSSVNACLRPIVSLDGCGVTTTEGIGSSSKGFHPVQERIAACNGTQCGFCTPGHVMAMYSLLRDKASRPESGPLSLAEVEERFDGNICRCTGYRAIMTACHTFADEVSTDKSEIEGLAPFNFPKYDPTTEPAPPSELVAIAQKPPASLRIEGSDGTLWYRPTTLASLKDVKAAHPEGRIVSGFTSQGVYGYDNDTAVFVDISGVPEISAGLAVAADSLVVASTTSITDLIRTLEANNGASASFNEMAKHFKSVASWQVRNVGSVGGNIMMCRSFHFMSDLATVLTGANAIVRFICFSTGKSFETSMHAFLRSEGDAAVSDTDMVMTAIVIPFLKPNEHYRSFRQAVRSNNAHAFVNAAFRMTVEDGTVTAASFVYGCIDTAPVFATASEKVVLGAKIDDIATLGRALEALSSVVLKPEKEYMTIRHPEGIDNLRRGLISSFLYKFFICIREKSLPPSLQSSAKSYERAVSTGTQSFKTVLPDDHPGRIPIPKIEASEQASGQSKFSGDFQFHELLNGAFAQCTQAPAVITSIDASEALAMPGVVDFVSGIDIPGLNSASPFAPTEEVLFPVPFSGMAAGATDEAIAAAKKNATVLYFGQPIGLIVARSRREAEAAAKKVKYTFTAEKGIFTLEDAIAAGKIDKNALQADKGDIEKTFAKPGLKIIEGDFSVGGQSHFAMEKHTTTAVPEEQGRMILYAATQGADIVRGFGSAVLGCPSHKVEVNVRRMGGGFGSKFTKNIWVTMAAAVAANKLKAPVRIQNSIEVDMTMGGNSRHPFKFHYKAAVDPVTQKVAAFDLEAFQDKGCASDFSGFVANEIISHAESLYSFEAIKVRLHMYNTHTSSNTAVRGPGIAQAIALGEAMMDHMASELNVNPEEFRKINFLTAAESTMSGIPLAPTHYTLPLIWDELTKSSALAERKQEIERFNKENKWVKRGIAMTPSRYSIAPGLNAGVTCLINVHGADMGGPTIEVHHGGHEMGQGLNTKVQQMVALRLGVPISSIHVHATSTAVAPNISITGGSIGSETTVAAARKACDTLLARIQPVKELIIKEKAEAAKKDGKSEPTEEPSFAETCAKAVGGMMNGLKVNLQVSENWSPKEGHLPGQIPGEFEQSSLPQGMYLAFGAGCSEVEVDILTGDVRVLRSDILYDCGHSLNPLIDVGQAEGAFVMGQGYYLGEEIHYAPDGECITKGTWEYKPPLATNMPRDFRVEFLKDSPYAEGVMRSKAVGEPPLVFAYSIVSAVKNAVGASRAERGLSQTVSIDVPATCDRVFAAAEVSHKDLANSLA